MASLPAASKADRPGVHVMIRQEIDSAYATVFAPIFRTVRPVFPEGTRGETATGRELGGNWAATGRQLGGNGAAE